MDSSRLEDRVASVRAFTRFYTRKAGVLHEKLLNSRFGLTEARVLYELAHKDRIAAKNLAINLDLDAGYISRVLRKFEGQNLIERMASKRDGREQLVVLTPGGRQEYRVLKTNSDRLFGELIQQLSDDQQEILIAAMTSIEDLLSEPAVAPAPYLIRPHRPGDMGWIVQIHGRIYTREFAWDETFEGLVAEITGSFLKNFDAKSDCCWMAEKDGRTVGSAMVVRADDVTAKLRVVIVDPRVRGLGIGERLVRECIDFAKSRGYARMSLWTDGNLKRAIRLYKKLGFQLAAEDRYHDFGQELCAQTWNLDLLAKTERRG